MIKSAFIKYQRMCKYIAFIFVILGYSCILLFAAVNLSVPLSKRVNSIPWGMLYWLLDILIIGIGYYLFMMANRALVRHVVPMKYLSVAELALAVSVIAVLLTSIL